MNQMNSKRLVAVIGAGAAGLYAARKLAEAGVHTVVFNRDIKPGGLAEYGIYHSKHKMKLGLRNQFRRIMDTPNLTYYGNVTVGKAGDLSLDDLRGMGFQVVLVAVGAQGTKWLGLPGEDLTGVYHAKDLVYHYNLLPPFSQQKYPIGQRVVLVGVGNVMLDIAHYAIRDLKVGQVTAIARRGPADVKFTKKEMANMGANLDVEALKAEIERTRPILEAVGQDANAAQDFILSALPKAKEPVSDTLFRLEFLAAPVGIVGDKNGRVTGVEVEETTLVLRDDGRTSAKGLGVNRVLPADTVVFCIGDKVDAALGLPLDKWQEFCKAPQPRYPINEVSFEAYDPQREEIIPDVFLVGWAREASTGLVGKARKDGQCGAAAAIQYLDTLPEVRGIETMFAQVEAHLTALGKPVVTTALWRKLDAAEQAEAERQGVAYYKFPHNAAMLEVMGLG